MLRILGAFFLSVILNNACAVGDMPKQLFRPLWRGAVGDGSPTGTLTLSVMVHPQRQHRTIVDHRYCI